MKKYTFLLLLSCLCMVMQACKTTKSAKKTVIQNDTTIVQIVKFDTTIVQIADSQFIAGKDAIKQVDVDYDKMLDSMQMIQALQDVRIKTLLSQLANKDFHLDPIQMNTGSAHATAGVDNNKLWLKLIIDSLGVVTKSTDNTTTINNTSTTEETFKKTGNTLYGSLWLILVILLLILCIAIIARKYFNRR